MSLNIDPKTGKIGYLIDLREGATVVLFQLVFSKSAIAEKEAQLTALSSPANESDRPPAPADQDEANAKGGQKQVAQKFSHIAVLAPTLLNRGKRHEECPFRVKSAALAACIGPGPQGVDGR
jgi:hypothetical protein